MKYFIQNPKQSCRCIFPNDVDKFGVVKMRYHHEWYCPKCGTFYLPISSYDYREYEKLLRGEDVIELKECKEEFLSDYDQRVHCSPDSIFIETRSVMNLEKATTTKTNLRNRPYYNYTKKRSTRFTDAFISSRDSLDRIEIIKENYDNDEYNCRYCKSRLISGDDIDDYLEPADQLVQEALPRYAYNEDKEFDEFNWEDDMEFIKGATEKTNLRQWTKQSALYKSLSEAVDSMIAEKYDSHITTAMGSSIENEELGSYINRVLNLEMDIRLLAEILKKLKLKDIINEQKVTKYGCASRLVVEEELSDIEQQINNMSFTPLSLDITPQDVNLTIPAEPVYKKASFFNRKKIESENAQKLFEYKKELSDFELEYAKRKEAELNQRKAQNATTEVEFYKKQDGLKEKREKLRNKIDSNEFEIDNPYLQLKEFYASEILMMEEKLTELCVMKKDLLGLGIIHPKYQDFIPLTTIAEYLETGRCDTLTGPNGAYNIYEQELRANIIIAKLDIVISKLEQIKSNQYKLYSLLSSMNATVDRMANSLDKAVTTLEDIQRNTEAIAYNTERTAYFAKIQNELTDSLGFLMAMK